MPADSPMVLVPREPSREQQLAMQRALLDNWPKLIGDDVCVNGRLLDAVYEAALSASPGAWRESFIAEEEEGPVVGILIDLPDGSQIWSGECSNALLEQAAEQEGSPADSGLFLMVAAKGKPTRPVAQVATVEDGIALARAVAACHAPAHPTPATPAVKGEVTDEWAERFCEAVNWSPDGQECKTVEGQLRCVSFRDLAKGYILAAIATDPCTPATPAGWIVSNANGDRWRTWEGGFSAWTDDREKATRYARREDAEAVHAEDEDAWRIEPYGPATPAGEEDYYPSHEALHDLVSLMAEFDALSGGGPGWPERWRDAKLRAEELVRVEP